jgi:chromate transporter
LLRDFRVHVLPQHVHFSLLFIPVIPAPYFKKYAKNTSIKAFVDGITAAVIGALTGAVIIIAINTFTQNHKIVIDVPSIVIAIGTVFALLYIKKAGAIYHFGCSDNWTCS